MQFKITLTNEDYTLFNLYHRTHMSGHQKSLTSARWSFLLQQSTTIMLLIIGRAEPLFIKSLILLSVIGSILWCLGLNDMRDKVFKKEITQAIAAGEAGFCAEEPSIVTFTDNAIIDEDENTKREVKYAKVKKIVSNDTYLYLYVSNTAALIFPDKVFESIIHKQQLIDLIQEKTGLQLDDSHGC